MPKRPLARRIHTAAAALVLSASALSPAWAQDAAKPERDNVALLKDFIHYVRIDNRELATEAAKALDDRGIKPADFATMVETAGLTSPFRDAVVRAQRATGATGLEPVAAKLLTTFEQGKLDTARNAPEISKNISLLTGNQRNRLVAIERLRVAGEYAMPQLLQALIQRNDPRLQVEVRQVLVDLGRQTIIPLCTALAGLDAVSQEIVVGVLGDIPYATSLPFLYELRANAKSTEVRTACDVAIRRIASGVDPSASPSAGYLDLAEAYYAESPSLTSFPGEPVQLLWAYDAGLGLIPTAIDTTVYHEAMAMRMSERSLTLDPQSGAALSLWLASNFKREIETPKGYENPAYPADRRDAMYYAVAAGPVATQRVLARAVDTRATMLARRAIAAIERTAGADGLWEGQADRRPLLEALRYPNRRVQYEAAMAVGAAQPRTSFQASERVVPILASAVRDASARYALVIVGGHGTDDAERANDLADVLRGKGYDVLPAVKTLADAEQYIAEKPGIDLVVTNLPGRATDSTIAELRGSIKLAATPILALVDLQSLSDLNPKYGRDQTVRLAREGLNNEQIAVATDQIVESAVGGAITEEEARDYKSRALNVLRDLAISGNTVLNVADAAAPLVTSLAANSGPMKLQIGEVLANIGSKPVQIALMDAALAAQGDERVALLGKTASSAKRYGNLLEPRQVSRVVELATKGAGDEATAAAALMGALNLSNDQLIPLIINKPETRQAAEAAR